MQQLKSAINRFLKNNGLDKGVNQQNAILIWEETVGKTIASNTSAETVEHGILTVKTASPEWRQELVFKKQDIIQRLNTIIAQRTSKF